MSLVDIATVMLMVVLGIVGLFISGAIVFLTLGAIGLGSRIGFFMLEERVGQDKALATVAGLILGGLILLGLLAE
jgi:hypothetical protein